MIDVDPTDHQEMALFVAACRLAPQLFWIEQEEFHSMFPPPITLKEAWSKVKGDRRDAYIVAAMQALKPYQPRILNMAQSSDGAA